ncbi:MAG: hypothetical protein Q8L48_25090 [Archangium sp.]|nr:hypothetical protein [Archangium sp.]
MAAEATSEVLATLVSHQRWGEALALCLSWWRRTRAPELADLIDWVGERVETPELRSHGAPADAFHTVWCHRLQNPAALRNLLPTLMVKLPEGPKSMHVLYEREYRVWQAALFERLEALSAVPADPRIAARLTAWVANMEVDHSYSHAAYRIAFDALAKLGDARAIPALQRAAAGAGITREHLRVLFSNELPACIRRLEVAARGTEPLDAAARELIRSLLPRPKATPESLLEQVLAAPERLELRHVWADALLERGDPRGEFVALQLKASDGLTTPKDQDRRNALQRKHQRAWLGPLADVLMASTVRFEAGCLVEAQLGPLSAASPEAWRRLSGERSLVTVKRLRRNSNVDVYMSFLTSPMLSALEAVEVANNPMLERVVESKAAPRVRQVTIEKTLNADTFDLLERLPRLASIHLGRDVRGGEHRKELARRQLQRVVLLDDGGW